MSNHPFEIERLFDAPVTKVWDALTQNEQLKKWYFQIADFKPIVGFEFQFIGKTEDNKEYLHLCKITEVVPGKKLVYSWRYDGLPGNSLVSFELFEEGEKQDLNLNMPDSKLLQPGAATLQKKIFAGGWTYILDKSLTEYLKT